MRLTAALDLEVDDVVAFVGGGGKSSAMFRLAGEIVDLGGQVITTTTTHIFSSQIGLAPAHIFAAEATPESVASALAAHGHVLVTGATDPATSRASGPSLELFARLREWFPKVCILNEADGSRMRPFKAPAAHEPVIPPGTTIVLPMVGADIFGKPLDGDHVHRPELISALSGAAIGTSITPAIVASVLAHPQGGRKGVPAGARVLVAINKADALADLSPARETARLVLRERAIDAALLTAVREPSPVLELHVR